MKAAIYTRISRDTRDPERERGLGVERQEEDCRTLADRLGWDVSATYVENDISASTRSRKVRPAYEQLLIAIRSGEITAVVAYSNSRLTRRPSEWIELINLAETHGLQINTVVSGKHDLTTADGRAVAITVAAWDAAEAERVAERVKRQKAQRIGNGLPPGGGRYRTFGYTRSWEVIPEEAEAIVEIFKRRAQGVGLPSICAWLNAEGYKTTTGRPWASGTLLTVVRRPTYAGLQALRGELTGGKTAYPAVIPEALWRQANSAGLKAQPGHNARKYLLSGFAFCGECSAPMRGYTRDQRRYYTCGTSKGGCGGVGILAGRLENPVVSLVLSAQLDSQHLPKVPTSPPSEVIDLEPIDGEIDKVKRAFDARTISLDNYMFALNSLERERREAEETQATTPLELGGSFPLWKKWAASSLSEKRVALARHVDSIRVSKRTNRRLRESDPERVLLRWKDGSEERLTQARLDSLPLWRDEEAETLRGVTIVLPPLGA